MKDRIMVFVDVTNLLHTIGKEIEAPIKVEKPPTDAIRLACMIIKVLTERLVKESQFYDAKLIRIYWFGSYQGSEEVETKLRETLRNMEVEPVVFRRRKGREKRVDLAIAREMLINASNQNFDIGVLVAGDEDYVDLVNDVKRYGPRIVGSFFQTGLSPELKLAVDHFHELHIWGDNGVELVHNLGGRLPE